MALLISFLIGIQLLHSVVSVPFVQFLHPSCNSLEVKAAAEAALNKHNKIQADSYIIGLQRIFDACQISEDDYSIFYLILDVLETKCHGWSKKSWKECEFRDPYETVFGQCKSIIKIYKNSNDTFLYDNSCILRPHLAPGCPGCPIRQNPSEERFQEIARQSLAKFNAENNHHHYFAILEVTKASSQVVNGILYAVEFTVQETSCHKHKAVSNITECPLLPKGTAETGLCESSVIIRGADEHSKFSRANCKLFQSQSRSEHQQQHHPHATEIPAKQKEALVQGVNKRAVREVQEPNPTFIPTLAPHSLHHSIPAFPKGFSQSGSCPGKVAIQIPGLHLELPPQAENSQTKSDVQH